MTCQTKRTLAARAWSIVVVGLFTWSVAGGQSTTLTLEEAQELAQRDNPEVRRLIAELDGAKAALTGAALRLRTNPSITASNGPRSGPTGRTRDYEIGLSQQLEIGGQRRARMDVAQASQGVAEARLRQARVDVSASVRSAFGLALVARARSQLADQAQDLARSGLEAAQERFDAGAATLLELNTARVELGRATRERGMSEQRALEALVSLQLLIGRELPRGVELQGELPRDVDLPLEAGLVEEALSNSAEVRASQSALAAATADARLANREWLPKPRLGVRYAQEEGSTDIVQGSISLDLPVFQRNQARKGLAAARVEQRQTELRAATLRVRGEVGTAFNRLKTVQATAGSFAREVVDAMDQNLRLGTESYREGKIGFLELLITRKQALDAQREFLDIRQELNSALANLNRTIGRIE